MSLTIERSAALMGQVLRGELTDLEFAYYIRDVADDLIAMDKQLADVKVPDERDQDVEELLAFARDNAAPGFAGPLTVKGAVTIIASHGLADEGPLMTREWGCSVTRVSRWLLITSGYGPDELVEFTSREGAEEAFEQMAGLS